MWEGSQHLPWIAAGIAVVAVVLTWWFFRRQARKHREVVQVPAAPERRAEARPAEAPEPAPPPTPPKTELRLNQALASSRGGFIAKISQLLRQDDLDDRELRDELEAALIGADVGVHTTEKLIESIPLKSNGHGEQAWTALRSETLSILKSAQTTSSAAGGTPVVWLVVGVNGVGKTTTIAKLAKAQLDQGKSVILGAADTFRAAAVQQLQVWGERLGVEVISGHENADPGSVAFETVKQAQAKQIDCVLIDTAGRLHTKTPLMEELKKVHRSAGKAAGRPVDEVLLVLDATSGQNALQQAKSFKEALPLTGVALTKLDGTAKGGIVLAVTDQLGLAIRFVGVGEGMEDLQSFDPETFTSALFQPISPDL